MINIRKYEPKDKENLVKVLYETSSLPIETEAQRKFLELMFNDYYTETEPDCCFVAANEDDEAVGYIICARDFDTYAKNFKNFYLPEIKELGFGFYTMALGEIFIHKLISKKYPAHLHIDILDVCQGQGVGTRLVSALSEYLGSTGTHGLMLSCGMKNTKAVKFYKKNNFKIIMNFMGNCLMGKEV
ncbi:MAG: GNAT family N-acetyltransferase [Clostridia bacterium]|nr:GNAT family N-acetyltransferase [Clostridia bacterium]